MIAPLVASASVPVPAPIAFVDQSMHGEAPSFVRFAPALKIGFLAVPPTIGASISKLLCPPETDVAFNVFGVAHVGANALGPTRTPPSWPMQRRAPLPSPTGFACAAGRRALPQPSLAARGVSSLNPF